MGLQELDLQKLLQKVMDEYEVERHTSFKDNDMVKLFQPGFKCCIHKNLSQVNDNKYLVKGSAGQGQWANVPWLGVFDRDITKTAQSGFYLVYLFSTNMNKVYLSLNQGWTLFKNNYDSKDRSKNIRKISEYFQNRLNSADSTMVKEIHLIENEDKRDYDLARGYEQGNIFAFEYKKNKLPSSNKLLEDLQQMLLLYAELKGNLFSVGNPEANVNFILGSEQSNELSTLYVRENDNFVYQVRKNINKVSIKEVKKLVSKSINKTDTPKKQRMKSKIDFLAKSIKDKEMGKLGEDIVFEAIKKQLKSRFGNFDRVTHTSEEDDSAGYDIKLKDGGNNDIYIEVKTTSGRATTPFFMSANEMKISEKYKEKYILVRLYDVNKNSNLKFKYYKIKGPFRTSQELNIKPINYQVEIKSDED